MEINSCLAELPNLADKLFSCLKKPVYVELRQLATMIIQI